MQPFTVCILLTFSRYITIEFILCIPHILNQQNKPNVVRRHAECQRNVVFIHSKYNQEVNRIECKLQTLFVLPWRMIIRKRFYLYFMRLPQKVSYFECCNCIVQYKLYSGVALVSFFVTKFKGNLIMWNNTIVHNNQLTVLYIYIYIYIQRG